MQSAIQETSQETVPAITICSIAHHHAATGPELTISRRDIMAIRPPGPLASDPKNLTVLALDLPD